MDDTKARFAANKVTNAVVYTTHSFAYNFVPVLSPRVPTSLDLSSDLNRREALTLSASARAATPL